MHMKFTQCKDGKYVLGQNSPLFDTIPEAVHFYTTHKLPIRGAEHLSLLFPVQHTRGLCSQLLHRCQVYNILGNNSHEMQYLSYQRVCCNSSHLCA
ncbi:hypothetical protein AMECASPLE_025693 [Ameca splendens]|uniref:SH2 domain-containing protein n=1 Tax=Ameca splendens TaxID=208324 RepID=A0ABV0ZFL2_9TELE